MEKYKAIVEAERELMFGKSESNIVDNDAILEGVEFYEVIPSEILEPTMNLRWKKQTRFVNSVNVEKFNELQQLWVCRNTGKQEWRAIQIEE
jgi:hypothetical protein